jgi:hypothetical protein
MERAGLAAHQSVILTAFATARSDPKTSAMLTALGRHRVMFCWSDLVPHHVLLEPHLVLRGSAMPG